MKMTNKILTAILICMPLVAWADLNSDIAAINAATDETTLNDKTNAALNNLKGQYKDVKNADDIIDSYKSQIQSGSSDKEGSNSEESNSDSKKDKSDSGESKQSADDLQKKVDDAQEKLDKAEETEQSTANRMLGGLTTLATGIGGMQLAQGIAEKRADSEADKDMDAYMATIKCTYGDGKSVPFSVEPVELPGGNNADLMKYRAEYIALAKDLKERKTALDMKPGIEAEEIIDKATAGLYDDENTGITGGAYASRYRAAAGNEKDQKGLKDDKSEAKKRMIAGGVIAGVGVVGGIVGNSIINGKLGELIKEAKEKKRRTATDAENRSAIRKIKNKAKDAGLRDTDYIDRWDLAQYNIGAYSEYIDDIEFDRSNRGERVRDLCPELSESTLASCADKLLTPESKKDLMGDMGVAGGIIGDSNSSITDVLGKVGDGSNLTGLLGGGSDGGEQ